MNKQTGGPAFPCHAKLLRGQIGFNDDEAKSDVLVYYKGMSVRDYFAAQALAPCIAEFWGAPSGIDDIAAAAYQIADAMLAERNK